MSTKVAVNNLRIYEYAWNLRFLPIEMGGLSLRKGCGLEVSYRWFKNLKDAEGWVLHKMV
jgi:hypothetical protein